MKASILTRGVANGSRRAYAGTTPTVYLPAHDPESAARLADARTVGLALETVTA